MFEILKCARIQLLALQINGMHLPGTTTLGRLLYFVASSNVTVPTSCVPPDSVLLAFVDMLLTDLLATTCP